MIRLRPHLLLAVLLPACDAHPPPARRAEPTPSAAVNATSMALAPSASSAASIHRDAGAAGCEGEDLDLLDAFSNDACYVLDSAVGADEKVLPVGIEVRLESTPATLKDHEEAKATLIVLNAGANRAVLYFRPLGDHLAVLLDLVDSKTLERHRDGGAGFSAPAADPVRLGRIALAPGGKAHLTMAWTAERKTGGHPPPRQRPEAIPLSPGAYRLVAWTGLPGFAPAEPDQTRAPAAAITITR